MERSIANHDARITTRRERALLHEHCILLVDDHFVVRRALAEALTMLGCHVVGVGDGEEALDTLRAGLSPCVIFLDPRMPRASGWSFRAVQLADPALADIPVVVLSAMDASPDMASALLVDEWLVKPPDPEAMLRLTASYCGHGAKAGVFRSGGSCERDELVNLDPRSSPCAVTPHPAEERPPSSGLSPAPRVSPAETIPGGNGVARRRRTPTPEGDPA